MTRWARRIRGRLGGVAVSFSAAVAYSPARPMAVTGTVTTVQRFSNVAREKRTCFEKFAQAMRRNYRSPADGGC